jgi:hypothetical protein
MNLSERSELTMNLSERSELTMNLSERNGRTSVEVPAKGGLTRRTEARR